ncbi:S-adenosyl-L-methionine-dependent methyltransferase [Sporodiniella umbellata]|nr:S-adenosyl-L-methionine-dependent methyltransferase [Sporodiniella umbellata]
MEIDTLTAKTNTVINPESLVIKREFHSEKASTYWLPKDAEEHDRLTGQHFAYKELLKGNISSSVRKSLDFELGVSILDIGCGSGAWLADMSSEYPNCTYHGCDIIDTPDIIQKLSKLNYVYGNVIQGLPYGDNTFDFVCMRFFVYALRTEEWPIAINEALRVVKPGGMVQFVDCTGKSSGNVNSICYKTMSTINRISVERGQTPGISYVLEDLVSKNSRAKIVQSYRKTQNTNDGTPLAKKFMWDVAKGVESMMKHLGPQLGVENKEDISDYLTKLKKDMCINGIQIVAVSVSVQKL